MSKSEGVAAVVPTSKAPIGSKGAEEKKEEPLKRRHGKETRESSGNGRGSSQDSAPACDRIALDESCKRSSGDTRQPCGTGARRLLRTLNKDEERML